MNPLDNIEPWRHGSSLVRTEVSGLNLRQQLLAAGHTIIAGVRTSRGHMEFRHEHMIVHELDVASTASVEAFARNVRSSTDSMRCILVNNAGRMDGRWRSLGRGRP